MPFIPHHELRLQSTLSAAEAVRALAAQVAPPLPVLSFGFPFGSVPFEGTVTESGFELQRIIHYRNSFRPQIRGAIEPTPVGCSVSVTMALHPLVSGFAVVWLMGVCATALVLLASAWQRLALSVETFMPIAMLSLFWLVVTASFRFEARKAEQLLRDILVAPRDAADKTPEMPRR
jgi:hypothetical protein